ncbi:MAG: ATP-grasp domain-containing protein [Dehalococcoidales bacterium]|nr:ATP-grasp domain-containing protein [Dehalococcoidales bacterium]
MHPQVAIIYNQPEASRYDNRGEGVAVYGVLDEVDAVKRALSDIGFVPMLIPLSPPIKNALQTIDNIDTSIVFNLFEGFEGDPLTEIIIARALTEKSVAYTGNLPEALHTCLDKSLAKRALLDAGVPTPAYQVYSSKTSEPLTLNFPVIVKPAREDASHGIYAENVVYTTETFWSILTRLFENSSEPVLVEEFVNGREFNATVLGKEVLPISEIVYTLPDGFPPVLTFESKWDTESLYYKHTQVICPAKIDRSTESRLKNLAIKACKACGCRGYTRVDMRADEKGKLYVLEVNPNPDISPGAGCARQSAAAGLSYTEFIKVIVEQAIGENTL